MSAGGFTGRVEELARLHDLLAEVERQPTAVVVSALSGTAGVGKTALAVHWARQVRTEFPDGQVYVNLRGFDPGGAAIRASIGSTCSRRSRAAAWAGSTSPYMH